MKGHAAKILQETTEYFAKWGDVTEVDLHEVLSGRCSIVITAPHSSFAAFDSYRRLSMMHRADYPDGISLPAGR